MEQFDALEVIARTRGKVELDSVPTGGKLFPLWGWLAAVVYSLEFLLWQLLHQEWCLWLWVLIPFWGPVALAFVALVMMVIVMAIAKIIGWVVKKL